jgi:hypothetical protein
MPANDYVPPVLSPEAERALIERVVKATAVATLQALTEHMYSLDRLIAAVGVTALGVAFAGGVAVGMWAS